MQSKMDQVREWLSQLDASWTIIQATEAGGIELTPNQVIAIAEGEEWAHLDDQSDLLYAKQGYLHKQGLILGTGDPAKAYRNESRHTAIFINAYLQNR